MIARKVEIALSDLGELHDPLEGTPERLVVTLQQGLEGVVRHMPDAIVLEVDEVHQAGVVLENADRVFSAAMNPVNVEFEPQQRRPLADDVQNVRAVIPGELDMVIVVIQADASLGKPGGHLVAPAAKIKERLLRRHGRERHHAHPHHLTGQQFAVRHDLVEVLCEGVSRRTTRGLQVCGESGNLHAELDPRAIDLANVGLRHGNLRDLNGIESQGR